MKRETIRTKRIMTCLGVICLLVAQVGCSPRTVSWDSLKFWQNTRQGVNLEEKHVASFVGQVRPRKGNPHAHYELAIHYQQRGLYQEAIGAFDKVIAIDPGYVKAYNGKGICLDQLGDHRSAAEHFHRALAIDGKLDYVWNNLCYSLFLQGEYEEAIVACEKAVSLNSRNLRMQHNLALAYAMAGRYEQAFKTFREASNGNDVYAHMKLAAIFYDKAMLVRAREQYQAALALDDASKEAKAGMQTVDKLLAIASAGEKPISEERATTVAPSKPAHGETVPPPLMVGTQDRKQAERQLQIARKLYEKGAFADARFYFRKALELNPQLSVARKGIDASEALAGIVQAQPGPETLARQVESDMQEKFGSFVQRVGIEISNGNGRRHMARDMGNYLKARGFNVVRLTNAGHFNHPVGSIHYDQDCRAVADRISASIPELSDLRVMEHSVRPDVKVRIVLGRNLLPVIDAYRN